MTYKKHAFWKILHADQRIAAFIRQRIESKIQWWRENKERQAYKELTGWKARVREIFYRDSLSITVEGEVLKSEDPQANEPEANMPDGTVGYEDRNTLIIDWRSDCPILRDCQEQGVPTLGVCSPLYHLQHQALLSLICPGAFFGRDYSRLRPSQDHCREIIVYEPEWVGLMRGELGRLDPE